MRSGELEGNRINILKQLKFSKNVPKRRVVHFSNTQLEAKLLEVREAKSSTEDIPGKQLKWRREIRQLQGELTKIKPLRFDGEKSREEVEVWILEMKKYLQLHDYLDNMEVRIAIYNL